MRLFRGATCTFRLDHCKFSNLRNRSAFFRNSVCGVVDHNEFVCDSAIEQITIYHDAWNHEEWATGHGRRQSSGATQRAVY